MATSDPWYVSLFDEHYVLLFEDLPKLLEQTEAEMEFIERITDLPKGARVLDLGCGFGRHAIALAQRLTPTGTLVLDVFNPLALLQLGTSSSYTRRNAQGAVHEQRNYQPLTGRLVTTRHFVGNDGQNVHYPNSDVRMYAPHELATLLASAGFVTEGLFGSLTGEAFDWQRSGVQVWLVRRKNV